MDLGTFASRFDGVRWSGDEKFRARCPCLTHHDGDPDCSLVARVVKGQIVVACFADLGDSTETILSAVGLTSADLRTQTSPALPPKTPAETFSANGAHPTPAINGKAAPRDFGKWQLEVGYQYKQWFGAVDEKERELLASTEVDTLVETLVTQAKDWIAAEKWPLWPLPELNETELDEELRRLALKVVQAFRDDYLPAVAEPRQVSVYEDIQPALTALRVYEADEFFDATADLENVEWRWDRVTPAVGIVGVFGDPESGKSTFLRTHSLCLERGTACLERDCVQSKVLYLDLANERLSHRRSFAKLGWTRGDLKIISMDSLIGLPNGLELVDKAIRQIGARVVVVDMMADLLRFKDLNDYADAKRALRGVRLLSQQTSTLIYVLHHTPKALGPDADVLKAGLGSQAIVGAFDLRIAIRRRAKNLSTLVMSNGKLGGEPLTEEIVLVRDPETEWITRGNPWAKHRSAYYVDQVVDFLKENTGERMGALRIAEELGLNAPWIRGSLALAHKSKGIHRTRIGRAYVYWDGEPDPVLAEKPPKEKKPRQLNLRRTTPRGDDPDDPDPNGISWSR